MLVLVGVMRQTRRVDGQLTIAMPLSLPILISKYVPFEWAFHFQALMQCMRWKIRIRMNKQSEVRPNGLVGANAYGDAIPRA